MGDSNFFNKSRAKSRERKDFEIPCNFKILIVDDNKDFLEALYHRMRRRRINVVAVESGSKALTAIENNGFDLILLDLKMPDMDGVETFRKITEIKNDCFVIIMTAYHDDERIKIAKKMNPFGFLEKPFEFAQLFSYIEKRLQEKRQ